MTTQPDRHDRNGSDIGFALSILVLAVTVVTYFEFVKHFYVIQGLGGYVVKIWLAPVGLLAVLWMLKYRQGRIELLSPALKFGHFLLACYGVLGVLSLYFNEELHLGVKYGLIMYAPVAFFLVVLEAALDMAVIKRMLVVLFCAGVGLASYTEYLYLVAIPNGMYQPEAINTNIGIVHSAHEDYFKSPCRGTADYNVLRHTLPGLEQGKFSAMLIVPIFTGFFLGLPMIDWRRYLFFGGSALMYAVLVASLSRAAAAALVVGGLVYVWYGKKSKKLIVPLVLVALLTGALYQPLRERIMLLPSLVAVKSGLESLHKLVEPCAEVSLLNLRVRSEDHFESLHRTMKMATIRPLQGIGATMMRGISEKEEHNRFLNLMITSGLMTVIPYAAFMGWLFWKVRGVLRSSYIIVEQEHELGAMLLGAMAATLVKLQAENVETYYYWGIFALAAAWLRIQTYRNWNSAQAAG